jgi:hypothetical protein
MALTNSQRQADYRARMAQKGQRRVNTLVSPEIYNALHMMATYEGTTLRDVVESLVSKAHARYCVDLSEEEFARYNVTPTQQDVA